MLSRCRHLFILQLFLLSIWSHKSVSLSTHPPAPSWNINNKYLQQIMIVQRHQSKTIPSYKKEYVQQQNKRRRQHFLYALSSSFLTLYSSLSDDDGSNVIANLDTADQDFTSTISDATTSLRLTSPSTIKRTIVTTTTNSSSTSSLLSCPFSKSFTRYRIDLTTTGKRNNDKPNKNSISSLLYSFFSKRNVIPTRTSPKWLLRQKILSKDDDNNDTQLIIQSNLNNGIDAITYLWEQTAKFIGMIDIDIGNDDDNDNVVDDDATSIISNVNNNNDANVLVLVMPDTSKILLQNFVEIINWMNTNYVSNNDDKKNDNHNNNDNNNNVHVHASFIDKDNDSIPPAIRLERIKQYNDSNHLSIDENVINTRTQKWVKRILVEQKICPFTKSDRMSGQGLNELGVPIGYIAYHISLHNHPIGLFRDTWKSIQKMINVGPKGKDGGISSILLAAPAYDDDFDVWAGPIFTMLEACVVAAQAESQIGVVCFHPKYATPDGKSWPGFGHMHSVPRLEKWYNEYYTTNKNLKNTATTQQSTTTTTSPSLTTEEIAAGGAWQRRTPHATINVLRADQLAIAESKRQSVKLYTENIDRLVGTNGIGNEKLATDLEQERQYMC